MVDLSWTKYTDCGFIQLVEKVPLVNDLDYEFYSENTSQSKVCVHWGIYTNYLCVYIMSYTRKTLLSQKFVFTEAYILITSVFILWTQESIVDPQ